MPLRKPFDGTFSITQLFGKNPQNYAQFGLKGHEGIDYGVPNGTPILAAYDGIVAEAANQKQYGNYVKLQHAWGETVYAHLDKFSVGEGDNVKAGDVIGQSDNTGNSTGAHLHFGLRINPYSRSDGWAGFSDPLPYLNGKALPGEPAVETDCSKAILPGDSKPLGWYRTEWASEKKGREQLAQQLATIEDRFAAERAALRQQADLWREQVSALVTEFTGSPPTGDAVAALRSLIQQLKQKIDPTDPSSWDHTNP